MKVGTQVVIAARQELLDIIDITEQEAKVGGLTDIVLSKEQAQVHLEILEWALERLEKQKENSRIYQKKASLVNKLIREHLSADEMAEIDRQAREKAGA